jgi:hypothetical protein
MRLEMLNNRVFQKERYNGIANVTVASVAKTFTLKVEQTIHRLKCRTMNGLYAFKCKRFRNTRHSNIWNTIVTLFLKHPALPVEGTLNRNYSR